MTRRPPQRLSADPDYAQRITAALTAQAAESGDPATDQIVDWLSRLMLFEGVPFRYLVPDPKMLPAESIRFFLVDEDWVTALVDGAFNIGAAAVGTNVSHNPVLANALFDRARARRPVHRAVRLGGSAPPAADTDGAADTTIVSGFVLRSAVVNVWPQMEVKGYAGSGTDLGPPLPLLRFDILDSGLALGLFHGEVATVTFSEPSEILHFGVNPPAEADQQGPVTKDLRYAIAVGTHEPGQQIFDPDKQPVSVDVPMRSGSATVVDITGLSGAILSGLQTNGAIAATSPVFTAAQFGMEMVEGVQEVTFTTATKPAGSPMGIDPATRGA